MTDKEKIRTEIDRQYEILKGEYSKTKGAYVAGRMDALDYVEQFINSLPEEPAPKESDDLKEAAEEYECTLGYYECVNQWPSVAFKAGAEWQKKQIEKNRLAACNNASKEDLDREVDFTTEIMEKEGRLPFFSDAIKYGMRLQKEQMLKDAVECVVYAGKEEGKWIMQYIGNYEQMVKACEVDDKVKIIILKDDETINN